MVQLTKNYTFWADIIFLQIWIVVGSMYIYVFKFRVFFGNAQYESWGLYDLENVTSVIPIDCPNM
jgi:hypothetical protein